MVAFEEGVHDQLPVRRHVVELAAEEMVAGEAEGVEFGRERIGIGEVGVLVPREPDQPARLAARQRLQPVRSALSRPGKVSGRGSAASAPSSAVGPGVIGAGDARRALHLAALDQPRAAMAADVPEDVRRARFVAGEQQRDAEPVMRDRHVRLGQQGGGRDHLRQPARTGAPAPPRTARDRYRRRPAPS